MDAVGRKSGVGRNAASVQRYFPAGSSNRAVLGAEKRGEQPVAAVPQGRGFLRKGGLSFLYPRTHLRKRHKVKDRGTGLRRFPHADLYERYGLYKVPAGAGWKTAHALV